jgi:hypothetical protein
MKSRFLMLLTVMTLFATAALASATWYVDGVHGSDSNSCKTTGHACKTIGHAISLAHSGDSIKVAAATYSENLTISISLRVIGAGVSTTIIDGGGVNTVVTISSAATKVTLANLTIRNGSARFGGGIGNVGTLTINNSAISHNLAVGGASSDGGGIANGGTLTINNSTVSNNSVKGSFLSGGGGVSNGGTLTINNSTISGNTASSGQRGAGGGGIVNYGTLTINNSTINNNVANGNYFIGGGGGGIANGGTLTINNSTVSDNTAANGRVRPGGGGGIVSSLGVVAVNNATFSGNSAQVGGGIYNYSGSAITLQNSIIAYSPSGTNCYNHGTMISHGYNVSDDGTCSFNGPGDLNNTDPKLGTLGNYGGPTQTIPLLSGSPAIDAGNPNGCTDGNGHLLKTDQRGKPRPDKEDTGGCDMGAYERQSD